MEIPPLRILLVEDNPDHAFISQRALQQAHVSDGVAYQVDLIEDGQVALDYLFQRGEYGSTPRPDLVLLDLQLPSKSGFEVLREVKSDPELRRIPVVVLTTSEAQKDIIRSYDLYANEYVTKPVNAVEYLEKVRAIPAYWTRVSHLPPRAADR